MTATTLHRSFKSDRAAIMAVAVLQIIKTAPYKQRQQQLEQYLPQ